MYAKLCFQADGLNAITNQQGNNSIAACFTGELVMSFEVAKAMTAVAVSFGCFNATSQDISVTSNEDESKLRTALTAIVQPIHSKLCSSADGIKATYALVIVAIIKQILNLH